MTEIISKAMIFSKIIKCSNCGMIGSNEKFGIFIGWTKITIEQSYSKKEIFYCPDCTKGDTIKISIGKEPKVLNET